MKNKYALFILTFTISFFTAHAQEEFPFTQGEILVQLNPGYEIQDVVTELSIYKGVQTEVQSEKLLSKNLNAWLLTFNHKDISHSAMLYNARNANSVLEAQLNYIYKSRVVPNDLLYNQQWQYEQTSDFDLDAEAAWDITTGGVTSLGDTIVVCVIDDGLEVSHPDWGNNIWYNHGEIPGNGIDDDGNGYIDDYRGWNADANTNNILPPNPWNTHGTPVAGIVAAKGNNGVGVSGVNWDVKMMFVVGGGNSSNSIAAYDYPLSCRKLYNQTNGASGAFVVATNASWGADLQNCATYAPLVNNMYDSLGVAGVLSTAATANANYNIDVQGDFPTSCSSDYLITVTNMQQNGTKVTQAGYGATTIDLGAYGAGTYTVAAGQTYGGFGGTSGATPHVTGTIGLLYSAPCARLGALARNQPAQTALMIKQILLSSTVSNSTLQNITVSEGVLNMKNALDSILLIGCSVSGCHEPYTLNASNITGTSADIDWESIDSTTTYYYQYREAGSTLWTSGSTIDTVALLTGLTACTFYEFQVAANCDSTNYSNVYSFKTGDCCDAPLSITTVREDKTSATFSWPGNPFAQSYIVEYRLFSASIWSTVTTTTDSVTLTGLDSCSSYEMRIQSSCAVNVNNNYSELIEFQTAGCGSCLQGAYCDADIGISVNDWIENVTLGSINNTSGNNGGYASFVNTGPTTDLERGNSYPISIDLGFNQGPWATEWRIKVWIDYDQNADFFPTERVFDSGLITVPNVTHTGVITIPATAELSRARMRVMVSWGTGNNRPCDDFEYGEVEEYCVNIVEPTNISIREFEQSPEWSVFPNPFNEGLTVSIESHKVEKVGIVLTTIAGQEVLKTNELLGYGKNSIDLGTDDLPQGVYVVTVHYADGHSDSKKLVKQ